MVDPELIHRKMALILEDLRRLPPVAGKPLAEFVSNPVDQAVAERYLERMIGRMIDINYHILTESGFPPPRDYYASFTQLGSISVYPPDFAARIASCAGLRNRLVHEYDEIDPTRLHESLDVATRDIPEYLRFVQTYLKSLG